MTKPTNILDTISIPNDVKAHIIINTRSDIQKMRVWVLCEAAYDMSLYKRFFKGRVSVYPANIKDDDGKTQTNCHTVMNIVEEIRNGNHTQRIIGIRDRDYTDYTRQKYKPTIPANVFMTDARDLEMMLYSSPNVRNAVYALHPDMERKIDECKPLLHYIASLRIWHERNNHYVRLNNNKFTSKCMCSNDDPKQLLADYREVLVAKYNSVLKYPGLMSVTHLNSYSRCLDFRIRSFYDICRGHDFTELVGKYLGNASITHKIISATLSSSYNISDFQSTKLAQDIANVVSPWGVTIESNDKYDVTHS